MSSQKFIKLRPRLYHLTNTANIPNIIDSGYLYSTEQIASIVNLANANAFLSKRRPENVILRSPSASFVIRDQKPIFEQALSRSLPNGWAPSDFVALLNRRVFFWPTLKDLRSHFGTYTKREEDITILSIDTQEVFSLNAPPLFCEYNSGATRPHPYFNGKPAPRGPNTFRNIDEFGKPLSQIREVTFEKMVKLPSKLLLSTHPEGPWKEYKK